MEAVLIMEAPGRWEKGNHGASDEQIRIKVRRKDSVELRDGLVGD
jgi:hypothetical protein